MKHQPWERYEARAKIAKAMAHPTRLLLLDAMRDNEMCVCDLTKLVKADQSTVSKHLAILKEAGLIGLHKMGPMNFYSVKCQCLDGFFGCMETVLRQNLAEQQALVDR